MATANFGTTNYKLPLIAVGMTDDDEQNQIEFWEMENNIDELNKELTYMEVFAESGYCQGAMFNARDTKDYLDIESGDLDTLNDEDAHYFYCDDAKTVKADYERDLEKIKEFLNNYKENWGGIELQRVAQFSNGEILYKAI